MNDNKLNISNENNKNNNIKNDEQNQINILFEKQNLSVKTDILFFKEDILKELKNIKQDLYAKFNNISIDSQEKYDRISSKNNELSKKMESISSIIGTQILNNSTNEINSKDREKEKEEIKRELLSNRIKIEGLQEELKIHKENYNNIIKENIIYKGIIGNGCKYKNMHQFFDYIILNINNLNNFKDKKILDNKLYEYKIENMLDKLNSQANSIIENCKIFTNESLKKFEEKINNDLKLYDSKLLELRIENIDYSKKVEQRIKELDELFNKIISIKNEININNEKAINEIRESNDKTKILFNSYENEFKSIKDHFNILSDFFKDIKFRLNLSSIYTKRDINEVANKLGFESNDKKAKKGQSAIIKNNNDNKVIINNINLEIGGVNKTNSKEPLKKDEKSGDNQDISKKYDLINKNEDEKSDLNNNNNNIFQKTKIRKVLKNEKLEKYNYIYENNNNTNGNISFKKKYPEFCVKNYNINGINIKTTDKFYLIKYRNGSAFPGLKNIYKSKKSSNINANKNEMHNYSSKEIYENCLMVSNYNKIIDIKKNTFLKRNNNNNYQNNNYNYYNNENSKRQSFTNRNGFEQEMNNSIYKDYSYSNIQKIVNDNNINNINTNRSMGNIFRKNEEDFFYKNLSNNKVKIKNLSCIQ